MTEKADLSGLLASRICHDLVSPVGAMVNGIDLVREIGAGGCDDEIAMIGQSAARASALLQFYRIAFGAPDSDATLSRGSVEIQANRMLTTPKVDLDWHGMDGPQMSRAEGRLLFQLLMCARAVLGMRGRIVVRLDPEGVFPISITVVSEGTLPGAQSLNQDALVMLSAEPAAAKISARQVEFALVHRSARTLGIALSVRLLDDGAKIKAVRS